MKKSTSLLTLLGIAILGLASSLYAGEAVTQQLHLVQGKAWRKPNLKSIPHVKKSNGPTIQGQAEYRVIDSLFNAYSFYDEHQQPLSYDPNTGLFAVIKRGALPPENAGNPNNSNSLRLLLSTDLGHSWQTPFSIYSGSASGAGMPRYPSVDISVPEGHNTLDEALFCFTSPLTKTGAGNPPERAWDGSVIGYQSNDLSSSSAYDEMGAAYQMGSEGFWWGTECTTAQYRPSTDDALYFCYSVNLLPTDSASTSAADAPAIGLWRKDFYNPAVKPQLTIPAQWMPSIFTQVSAPSQAWRVRNHIAMHRDNTGNFYNAVLGAFASNDDPQVLSVGVSRSTDYGATWGDFNVMPISVLRDYATSIGCDPDSVAFSMSVQFTDGSIRLSNQAFAVYGDNQFSVFTQLFTSASEPVGPHIVECYYNNGQWNIRKVADVSMFEDSQNWRDFDNDGTLGDSQMGNEMQACVTADGSTIVCKYLEAKTVLFTNDINEPDSIMSTDVVINTRKVTDSKWSDPLNVTQSDIVDRITWLPTTLPNNLKNIPLVTIQTADKGTSISEQLNTSQKRLASSSSSQYDQYKQYVCMSNFDVDALPLWDGYTMASVGDDALTNEFSIAPNPANSEVTVHINAASSETVVDVINALGQTVMQKRVSSTMSGDQFVTLNTNSLTDGSYLLRLTSGSQCHSKKLSIVH